jgi:hypothetical protein
VEEARNFEPRALWWRYREQEFVSEWLLGEHIVSSPILTRGKRSGLTL